MTAVRKAWGRLGRGERGYSLIELLITMSVLGIVLGALTTIFVSGSKAELDMNRRFQAEQNARIAFSSLRTDLHVASCAEVANGSGTVLSAGTSGQQLLIFTGASYTSPSTGPASRGDCATGDQGGTGTPVIVWCAYQVTPSTVTRYVLYRLAASACPSSASAALSAGGVPKTDYLNNGSTLFVDPNEDPTQMSGRRQGITVTLSSSTGTSTSTDTYTLTDTMILRNSPRTT